MQVRNLLYLQRKKRAYTKILGKNDGACFPFRLRLLLQLFFLRMQKMKEKMPALCRAGLTNRSLGTALFRVKLVSIRIPLCLSPSTVSHFLYRFLLRRLLADWRAILRYASLERWTQEGIWELGLSK